MVGVCEREHGPARQAGQTQQKGGDKEGDVGANHENVAMSKIDQGQHPVNQGIAQRNEGVERPHCGGIDQMLDGSRP